jgi:CrcB protein
MNLLAVIFGGALGAVVRWGVSLVLTPPQAQGYALIIATLSVNMIGCLFIGIAYQASLQANFSEPLRLFIITGFLGALTTFSTFALENIRLFKNGDLSFALLNLLISNIGGISMAALGLFIASKVFRPV